MTLKEAITEYVRETDHVSFAELHTSLGRVLPWDHPGFDLKGDHVIELHHNLILWFNMSEEFVQAVVDLRESGIIKVEPCPVLVYLADGMVPSAPVAKQNRAYKEPHWLPVVLRRGHALH